MSLCFGQLLFVDESAKLAKRLKNEARIIRLVPFSVAAIAMVVAGILCLIGWGLYDFVISGMHETIESQKSVIEGYKTRFGDLSNAKTEMVGSTPQYEIVSDFDGKTLHLSHEPISGSIAFEYCNVTNNSTNLFFMYAQFSIHQASHVEGTNVVFTQPWLPLGTNQVLSVSYASPVYR